MPGEKGNGGEREVAALIEPWWRVVEPEASFVRTPSSGGWGKREVRAGFRASGDLMTTGLRFPFTVEVKRREAWTWERLEAGKGSPVWGWWRQTQTSANESGLDPMMWFRKNREPWRVMLPYGFVFRFDLASIVEKDWVDTDIAADYGDVSPVCVRATLLLALPALPFALSL